MNKKKLEITEMKNEITEMGYQSITLNENQVSKIIGTSPTTLKNWRDQGIGPGFKKMEAAGKKGRVIYTKLSVATWLCDVQKTI